MAVFLLCGVCLTCHPILDILISRKVVNVMKWDISITLSVIIAIVALISPIITTIINNSHQRKMKELEMKQQHYEKSVSYQKGIFENYLRKAGRNISTNCMNIQTDCDYNEAYLAALMYAPKELREDMILANKQMVPGKKNDTTDKFESIISDIQKYIDTL